MLNHLISISDFAYLDYSGQCLITMIVMGVLEAPHLLIKVPEMLTHALQFSNLLHLIIGPLLVRIAYHF